MSWIKLREDLKDDPSVLRMAGALKMDVWGVIGRLSDVWSWVGRHTATGEGVGLDEEMIDLRVQTPGFAAAMRKAQWLAGESGALHFPHWNRHNSQSAKARALDSEARNRRRGGGQDPDKKRTLSGAQPDNVRKKPDQEKRREEKKRIENRREEESKSAAPLPGAAAAAGTAAEELPLADPGQADATTDAESSDAAAPPHSRTAGEGALVLEAVPPPDASVDTARVVESGDATSRQARTRGTLEEVREFCRLLGLSGDDAQHCFYKWEGNGWVNGGKSIRCWRSTIRSWLAAGYLPRRAASQSPPAAPFRKGGTGPARGVPARTYANTGDGPATWNPASGEAPPALGARSSVLVAARSGVGAAGVPPILRGAVASALLTSAA